MKQYYQYKFYKLDLIIFIYFIYRKMNHSYHDLSLPDFNRVHITCTEDFFIHILSTET